MNLKTISIYSLILVSFIAIGCISPQTEVPKTETTPTVTPIQITQTIIPMEYAHSTLTKDKVDEVVGSIKGNSFVRETEIHDTEVTIIYDVEKKDIDIAVRNSIRMLALFPDLQQINIIEYASGQKVVETSLTREDANNIVGHDVSEYGENLDLWRREVIDGIIYDHEKLEQIFNQISIARRPKE